MIEEKEYGQDFSSNQYIENNLQKLYKDNIIDGTGQLIFVVVGPDNSTKTSLSLWMQQYLNGGEVETDWISLNHDEWERQHTSIQGSKLEAPKKKLVYEEGRESFNRSMATTKEYKSAKNTLYEYRSFQNVLIINFQDINDLAPYLIQNKMIAGLFRMVAPGRTWFYAQQTALGMWSTGRYRKFTGWIEPDFKASFKNPEKHIPEKWKEYEEANLKNLSEKNKIEEAVNESNDLSDLDIGKKQLQAMNRINESRKCTTKDLMPNIYSDSNSVNRSTKNLIEKGFLKKQLINNKNHFMLTDKGEALLELT